MKKFLLFALMLAFALPSCNNDNSGDDDDDDDDDTEETVTPPAIVLNEINGTGDDADKYIELFNTTEASVSLNGYTIHYNNASSDPGLSWTGTTETLSAGGYLLLKGTKSDTYPGHDLATGLSGTQGIVVELRDRSGNTVDLFTIGADDTRSKSYSRIPDGTGDWYLEDPEGTPGRMNGTATSNPKVTYLPVIRGVEVSPERPAPDDEVAVAATVINGYGTKISKVVLSWKLDDVAQDDITMTGSGPVYTGTIPEQVIGSSVEYTVTATTDDKGTAEASGSYTVTSGVVETTGRVYINEVDPEEGKKYWELWNAEDHTIDLSGWKMEKDDGDSEFIFPAGTLIEAESYLVLSRNAAGSPTFGISPTKGFKYDLYDAEGTLIDTFDNFGDNQFHGDIPEGHTIGRITDGDPKLVTFSEGSIGSSNSEGTLYDKPVIFIEDGWFTPAIPVVRGTLSVKANISFYEEITSVRLNVNYYFGDIVQPLMSSPNGGFTWTADNVPVGTREGDADYFFGISTATGSYNSENYYFVVTASAVDYSNLVINEVDGNYKFVEIYNNGDEAIPLAGITLTKNEQANNWWTGPASATIAPKGYYAVVQSGELSAGNNDAADEFTGANGISAKQTLKMELKDPDGNSLDIFQRTADGLSWGTSCTPDYSSGTKYSFSRCPDGTGDFGLAVPSCNSANPATSAGPIVID